jgi:hypothetical protein
VPEGVGARADGLPAAARHGRRRHRGLARRLPGGSRTRADGCPDKDPITIACPCPRTSARPSGIRRHDGCPDPDPDRDSVKGEADKCPNEPETKNLFDDEDGCPDTIPRR